MTDLWKKRIALGSMAILIASIFTPVVTSFPSNLAFAQVAEEESATVIAYKVVCDDEQYLPNMNGGSDITPSTAQDRVAQSDGHCELAEGRNFQRGNESADNGGDGTYGEATGTGRTTFGDDDNDGVASIEVPLDGLSKIQMREINEDGYIPFDSTSNGSGSAEFYCHTDVGGYDNRERITGLEDDATYYCVAFNAEMEGTSDEEGNLHILKLECPRESDITVNDVMQEVDENSDTPMLSNNALDVFGCELAEGHTFAASDDIDGDKVELGETDENGYLYASLEEGYHRVGETDEEGERIHSDEMIGFGCFNINNPEFDEPAPRASSALQRNISFNPHNVAISPDFETVCIAINPMEEDEGNLHILKVTCPMDSDVGINALRNEVDQNAKSPSFVEGSLVGYGCEMGAGYEFAAATDKDGEKMYLGETDENGYLYASLDEDYYRVGETDEEGERVHSDEMIGFGCFNINHEDFDEPAPYAANIQADDISFNPHNVAIGEDFETVCIAVNPMEEVKEDTAMVVFHKIVCEDETDLPNWNGGADITADTAEDFVDASNGNCRFAEGREFEWTEKEGSADAGDETYGYAGGNRNTIAGSTNASGILVSYISLEETQNFAFREVNEEGYISFDNPNGYGAEFYCNTDVANYDNYEFIDEAQEDETYHCVAINVPEKKYDTANVVLHKIVCDDEKYLPNRGKNGAKDIDENTAKKFVKNHANHCRFENDRTFQYAPKDNVPNPGDNMLTTANAPWMTIDPTNASGMTQVEIPLDMHQSFAFREVLQAGYVPFSHENDTANGIKKSAEIYCHEDGVNYDNRDFVENMSKNETYHCVAFNALTKQQKGNLSILKVECPRVDNADEELYAQKLIAQQATKAKKNGVANPYAEIDREEIGCERVAGYEFGYASDMGTGITVIGSSNEDGLLETTLHVGEYEVGELFDDTTWMNEEDMIDMECFGYQGPNPEIIGDDESSVGIVEDEDNTDNPQTIYIHKNQPTYCLAINPMDDDNSEDNEGNLHILKLECPWFENVTVNDVMQEVDENSATPFINADSLNLLGCELSSGHTFMVASGINEDKMDLGETNEDGYLYASLPEGYHRVGETDGDDEWVDSDEMIGFGCFSINNTDFDKPAPFAANLQDDDDISFNPHNVAISEDFETICIAINPMDDDGVTMCEEFGSEYATDVEDVDQGNRKNGTAVLSGRSDATDTLGMHDGIGSPASGFYSLGFGGSITVSFDTTVHNTTGDDLAIHEITNGRTTYPDETATIEVSNDGSTWTTLGTANSDSAVTYFDLDDAGTGMDRITYVRITDTSNAAIHDAVADGFDLDAVHAIYACTDDDTPGNGDGGNGTGTNTTGTNTTVITRTGGGRSSSIDNVILQEDDDEEDDDSDGLPQLLETGGGEDEDDEDATPEISETSDQPMLPQALILGPGAESILPLTLSSTGSDGTAKANALNRLANIFAALRAAIGK